MRALVLVPFVLLAACGGAEAPEEKAAAATSLTPGQWQVVSEVTRFESVDDGTPAIDTPVGTRSEASYCVGEEEGARPAPALFAADDSCAYDRAYMRNGRINSGLTCNMDGRGQIMRNVTGTFTAESFEAELESNSYFPGDGDFRTRSTLTGSRTGDCVPEAAAAAQ